MSNGIFLELVFNNFNNDFKCIEVDSSFATPENIVYKRRPSRAHNYITFYFVDREHNKIINRLQGIILLHNTWTPILYKKMSKKKFQRQNIFIAKLLNKLLNNTIIKFNYNHSRF